MMAAVRDDADCVTDHCRQGHDDELAAAFAALRDEDVMPAGGSGPKPSVAGPIDAGGGLAVCFCMEVRDSLPDISYHSVDLTTGCYVNGCG